MARKLIIPPKAPRNGHVAGMMTRGGGGAHGKTRKAERRAERMLIRNLACEDPEATGDTDINPDFDEFSCPGM